MPLLIALRLLAAAMLFNKQGDLLMMKRSPSRTLSPGMWGAVGGHVEPGEIRNPRAACLREIQEETGIEENQIKQFQLQYILIRLNQQELRQQFFYAGLTDAVPSITTEEGDLFWIPRNKVFVREIPFVYKEMLKHYWKHGPSPYLWLGTARRKADKTAYMEWTPLQDPLYT
ncbi:NUDIX hydrolase [Paenibacillus larvae]